MVRRRPVPGSRTRLAWRLGLLALVALAALALSAAIDPLQSGALTMLPAVALAAVMLIRPYPGARAITRRRARRMRRARRATLVAAPLLAPTRLVRGGRLISAALAGRAPPPARAGCH